MDKNIISKSLFHSVKKLQILNIYFVKNSKKKQIKLELIEIELYGEEHTMGNLLATALQKCPFVREAGYVIKHPLADVVTISYRLEPDSKPEPITVLKDTINYLVKVFQKILNDATKGGYEVKSKSKKSK